MSYRMMSGLGATRPTWCPPRSLPSGVQDPCEQEYSFDIPIWGRTTMAVPVNQMTTDALNTAEGQLEGRLDRNLPMLYEKLGLPPGGLRPFIEEQKASLLADLEYTLTDTVQKVLDKQVLPAVRTQEEAVIAEAEVVVEKALLGLGVVTGLGLAAWWFLRK